MYVRSMRIEVGPEPPPPLAGVDFAHALARNSIRMIPARSRSLFREAGAMVMGAWTRAGRRLVPAWGGLGRALLGLLGRLGPANERRVHLVQHDALVDDALGDVLAGGQLVHDVEQHLLEDGPQSAGAGGAQDGLVGDGAEGLFVELQFDAVE